MTRVSEMLAGRGLSPAAIDTAHRIRRVLTDDLDEYDMANAVRELNELLNAEGLLSAAWPVLTSNERSAWKELLKLEKPIDYRY